MKVKTVLIISTLLFTSCILGCSEDSAGPSTSSVIMPLAVGNEWVYKVTQYNNDGTIDTTYLDTLRIRQSAFYGGDSVYQFDSPVVGANRSDGYYISIFDSLRIIAKYPTFSGEVFRVDTLRGSTLEPGTFIMTFSCELTNTTIAVPAGSFLSNKYRLHTVGTIQEDSTKPKEYFENLDEYWYAPGIGEVKSISYFWNDSLVLAYKRELISYHLN